MRKPDSSYTYIASLNGSFWPISRADRAPQSPRRCVASVIEGSLTAKSTSASVVQRLLRRTTRGTGPAGEPAKGGVRHLIALTVAPDFMVGVSTCPAEGSALRETTDSHLPGQRYARRSKTADTNWPYASARTSKSQRKTRGRRQSLVAHALVVDIILERFPLVQQSARTRGLGVRRRVRLRDQEAHR